MTNTFQAFKDSPDKDTLLQVWCEFITRMAEDSMDRDVVMQRLLKDPDCAYGVIELCGATPKQLYHDVLARQENQA